MSKKKKRIDIIYSTNPNFDFEYEQEEEVITLPPKEQNLQVLLDKKQRKGKSVTLVTGFEGLNEDLKDLGRILKSKCGVGGSVKDNKILIQGDFRDKVMTILLKLEYKVKKLGS